MHVCLWLLCVLNETRETLQQRLEEGGWHCQHFYVVILRRIRGTWNLSHDSMEDVQESPVTTASALERAGDAPLGIHRSLTQCKAATDPSWWLAHATLLMKSWRKENAPDSGKASHYSPLIAVRLRIRRKHTALCASNVMSYVVHFALREFRVCYHALLIPHYDNSKCFYPIVWTN